MPVLEGKTMIILGVDPGPEQSGWVVYEPPKVLAHGITLNQQLRAMEFEYEIDTMAIEMVANMGMPQGVDIHETIFWIGRVWETLPGREKVKVYRRDVKLHMCNSSRATDSNINISIWNRFGGNVKKAKGTKDKPGPLFGVTRHCLSALAVAITYAEGGV